MQHAKGEHVVQRRKRREALRPYIMLEVARLVQKGAPIGGETFARAGKETGASASTRTQRIYYEQASAEGAGENFSKNG